MIYSIKQMQSGLPIPDVEYKINNPDSEGNGEIIVKGPNVMLGYYKDLEGTDNVLKKGWFYTGDLGRIDDDGFLYITGRCKSVIVTQNGKNIYPEEIEYHLDQYSLIAECIVIGVNSKTDKETYVNAKILPNMDEFKKLFGKNDIDKKEIEMLERKLEQLRQKQEEEKSAEKAKENKEVEAKEVGKTEAEKEVTNKTSEKEATQQDQEHKTEIKELSLDDVKEILDNNFTLKETMIEQGAAYDKENYVRQLTSEINQDQLLGSDTTSKEAELETLLTQENHWQNAKANQAKSEQEPAPLIHPDAQVSIT